jgi:hypothetical protein
LDWIISFAALLTLLWVFQANPVCFSISSNKSLNIWFLSVPFGLSIA